jgi:two-component sensor histidine kinase
MFGELALIDESPRSASALAKTNVIVKMIYSEQLKQIIAKADPILRLLLTGVMRYFRSETERLHLYQYSQNLKTQIEIRQQAMEQAFHQIHNGPLQTLALLLKQVQQEETLSKRCFAPLKALDLEIRKVGENLTETANREQMRESFLDRESAMKLMRLGEGTILKLDRPLHELFYSIFTSTLTRDFPYFQNIRIKVRDFEPYPNSSLDLGLKREICFCLEEALCNIGKHAKGTTKIIITGKHHQGRYILRVQDNGCGLVSSNQNRGTKLCQKLMERLQGEFRRESLPEGGVLFEMSWPTLT